MSEEINECATNTAWQVADFAHETARQTLRLFRGQTAEQGTGNGAVKPIWHAPRIVG